VGVLYFVAAVALLLLMGAGIGLGVAVWARFNQWSRTPAGLRTVGTTMLIPVLACAIAFGVTRTRLGWELVPGSMVVMAYGAIATSWFVNASLVSNGLAPLRLEVLLHPPRWRMEPPLVQLWLSLLGAALMLEAVSLLLLMTVF